MTPTPRAFALTLISAALFGCPSRESVGTSSMAVLGAGMGLAMISLLLHVQRTVSRAELGLATSLNQFARSIGSAVGVAIMGAILASRMAARGGLHGFEALPSGSMTLDPVARETSVEYVRGSHRWGRWFQPRFFKNAANLSVADPRFEPVPDIDAMRDRYELLGWALEPGTGKRRLLPPDQQANAPPAA